MKLYIGTVVDTLDCTLDFSILA